MLTKVDQNSDQEPQKPDSNDTCKAQANDTITLSGTQLKSLIKEYTKVCVREELSELLLTLLAQKKVHS